MNRLSTTNTIVIFIVSVLIGVFLVWPKYQELKTTRAEIVQKEAELLGAKEYVAELHSLSEELGKFSNEMTKVESALPSRFSVPSFLNYIQKTTSESGLVLKSYGISPQSSAIGEGLAGIKENKFSLNLSGSYSSFKGFLAVLEKSSRLIETENITFTYSAQEKGKPLDFALTIKVYSY